MKDPDLQTAEQIAKQRVRSEKIQSKDKAARMRNLQKSKNSLKKRMSKHQKCKF